MLLSVLLDFEMIVRSKHTKHPSWIHTWFLWCHFNISMNLPVVLVIADLSLILNGCYPNIKKIVSLWDELLDEYHWLVIWITIISTKVNYRADFLLTVKCSATVMFALTMFVAWAFHTKSSLITRYMGSGDHALFQGSGDHTLFQGLGISKPLDQDNSVQDQNHWF